ncbi:MAG: acylphosphatase [Opitutaceae bacterium]|nr:acylphosphatase [Opitutaceae bacterium]
MKQIHREEVFFSGRVQGVGFRYSTRQVAKEYEVTGRVTNLADGRVHLVAEGSRGEVDAFIASVEERMFSHIRKMERRVLAGAPEHRDFEIG